MNLVDSSTEARLIPEGCVSQEFALSSSDYFNRFIKYSSYVGEQLGSLKLSDLVLVTNLSQASPVLLVRPDSDDGSNNTYQEESARPDCADIVHYELPAELLLFIGLHLVVLELWDGLSFGSRSIVDQSYLVSSERGALALDGEGGWVNSGEAYVRLPRLVFGPSDAYSLVAHVRRRAYSEQHFNMVDQLLQVVSLLSLSLK